MQDDQHRAQEELARKRRKVEEIRKETIASEERIAQIQADGLKQTKRIARMQADALAKQTELMDKMLDMLRDADKRASNQSASGEAAASSTTIL